MTYHDAIKQLEAYRTARDLDGFERTMDEIRRQIDPVSTDRLRVAVYACGILNSYDFGDHIRQMNLLHRYAAEALNQVSNPPVEDELALLSLLEHDFAPQERKQYTQRWLEGLRQIAAERDPHFDYKDVPDLNVTPPPEVAAVPGLAPEHLAEPAARKRYEAAIEANRQKSERFNRQYRLRQLSDEFTQHAVRYVGRAYARPPAADDELRLLFDEQKATADIRHAIWELVQEERKGST
jgi:hypothetical protein